MYFYADAKVYMKVCINLDPKKKSDVKWKFYHYQWVNCQMKVLAMSELSVLRVDCFVSHIRFSTVNRYLFYLTLASLTIGWCLYNKKSNAPNLEKTIYS
jgi:hypothetical protein